MIQFDIAETWVLHQTTLPPMRLQDPYAFRTDDLRSTSGLKCELKNFEARHNSKGDLVILEAGTRETIDPPKKGHDSALVLTRLYNEDSIFKGTELLVKSPHLNEALKKVITKYPGVNLRTQEIVITDAPRCLFHYRKELLSYGDGLHDNVAIQHLNLLMNHMWQTFHSQLMNYYSLMESPDCVPSLLFENLWMAFKPGCLLYHSHPESDCISRLKSMEMIKQDEVKLGWALRAEGIHYNGEKFGYVTTISKILPYEGYVGLEQLSIFPLAYSSAAEQITNKAISKGKKFVALRGMHHKHYEGVAKALGPMRKRSHFCDEEDEIPMHTTTIKGRVMIDAAHFALTHPCMKESFSCGSESIEANGHEKFSDQDFMICSSLVHGFSFAKKCWCYLNIHYIEDVEFNKGAFDQLIIPEEQKKMILSLVKVHTDEDSRLDDIIEGKGKGMVFLLHGTSGVGKTLTAESVADHAGRPLYRISCGELGGDATFVEDHLTAALELATCWRAIVLLDEADVFLEQRSISDLHKNGLVSILLHLLEHFEGILFLTTNRIGRFDAAFKSRIHLAIKYDPLPFNTRRELWHIFLSKTNWNDESDGTSEARLDTLASEDINGRQIKNVVRTAYAMAVANGEALTFSHIEVSLKAVRQFEAHVAEDIQSGHDTISGIKEAARKRKRLDEP